MFSSLSVDPLPECHQTNTFQDEKKLNKHNQFDGAKSLMDGSELQFDGQYQFSPKYADFLICLAIIEGYVAVRSPKEGTVKLH